MKLLSLFSGIGAFEKALKRQNIDYELVGFCEKDKYAIKSYCTIHNVKEDKNLGDITKIDIDKLPKDIDLITHGSPCQDFSVAGKGAGGDEGSKTRSSLMWNTVEIIECVKPGFVIWENVKNLLSKKHRHNFDKYIEVLNDLGYNSYYEILNAKDYGIPQRRERVFTVSIRKDIDKCSFLFPEKQELKLKLKDLLEKDVDDKYYLSDEQINKLKVNSDTERLLLRNATKQGYLEACIGDSVNLEQINSKTRRGRVGKEISQTLNTSDHMGVVVGDSVLLSYPSTPKKRIYKGMARTLTTQSDSQGVFTE